MWSMETHESDIDLFRVYQAPSDDILLGKPQYSTHTTRFAPEMGTKMVDIQTHELGKVIEMLLKNNWNFVSGVLSPIAITPWEHLGQLRILAKEAISKQVYHSIHGLAIHNYKKYIQSEKDYGQKRLDTIGRVLEMGIKLLSGKGLHFQPVSGTTRIDIENGISNLEFELRQSSLPDSPPNPEHLRMFLLRMRYKDLQDPRMQLIIGH